MVIPSLESRRLGRDRPAPARASGNVSAWHDCCDGGPSVSAGHWNAADAPIGTWKLRPPRPGGFLRAGLGGRPEKEKLLATLWGVFPAVGGTGDEEAQERHAAKRPEPQACDRQEAGDRDRARRGSCEGREGAAQAHIDVHSFRAGQGWKLSAREE